MNEQHVIRTGGLTRYFGANPAVYELNLEVPRGGVFALLGRKRRVGVSARYHLKPETRIDHHTPCPYFAARPLRER